MENDPWNSIFHLLLIARENSFNHQKKFMEILNCVPTYAKYLITEIYSKWKNVAALSRFFFLIFTRIRLFPICQGDINK